MRVVGPRTEIVQAACGYDLPRSLKRLSEAAASRAAVELAFSFARSSSTSRAGGVPKCSRSLMAHRRRWPSGPVSPPALICARKSGIVSSGVASSRQNAP